jgi:hypothetical protein
MTERARKHSRRFVVLALAGGLFCSMMYVSFSFGFRAGTLEDTVFVLPRC